MHRRTGSADLPLHGGHPGLLLVHLHGNFTILAEIWLFAR